MKDLNALAVMLVGGPPPEPKKAVTAPAEAGRPKLRFRCSNKDIA